MDICRYGFHSPKCAFEALSRNRIGILKLNLNNELKRARFAIAKIDVYFESDEI